MNAEKLKKHAILLEEAIKANVGHNKDVDFLLSYGPLWDAVGAAKNMSINAPERVGLTRWSMESNIGEVQDVANRLAQFEFLLEGRDILPSEDESFLKLVREYKDENP